MLRPGHLRTLQILVFVSISSGFIYGYNVGVYSGVMLQVQQAFALSDGQLGDLIAVFDFAEILGVLIAPMADRIGRKRILLFCAAILSVVPFLLLADLPFWGLLVERAITGCIAGITFTIGLVFIAEIARPGQQATLLSSLMVGISAGYVSELALSALFVEGEGWRLVIMLAAGPALLQLVGLLFMPESPVFHLLRNDLDAARRSARYYGVRPELSAIESRHGTPGAFEMLRVLTSSGMGRSLLLGSVIVLAGSASGAGIANSYGPLLLYRFGITDQALALEILMLLTLLGFLVGLLALIPISRGRSADVLVSSLVVASVSLVFLTFTGGYWAVACLGLLHLAFCFGIRTTVFQLLPDFLTDETRVAGMAAFNLLYILCSGTKNEFFPMILHAFGSFSFTLFAVAAAAIAVLSWLVLRMRPIAVMAGEP